MESVTNLVVKKVISAIRLLNSPIGITTYRENRERWAFILKQNGKTTYTVGKTTIQSDGLHPVLLPKGCSYSWKCTEPGACLIIEFEADCADAAITSFEISDNAPIINAFSKIEKSMNRQNPYRQLECYIQLYGILLLVAECRFKEPVHPQKSQLVYPAMRYITERYFDSSITNSSLSALCGISTVYFRKTFEVVYGVSPIQYLHNFRIQKAKAILRSDYGSIEQVALSVGYNSIYHFSKMFKQYTGRSPREYSQEKTFHKGSAR